MAAKLEWDGDVLNVALWDGLDVRCARAYGPSLLEHEWNYVITGQRPSKSYENEADCRQDCESEVRRLLKEAGVEVVP